MTIYRKYFDEEDWELVPLNIAVNLLEGRVYRKGTVRDMINTSLETTDSFPIRTPNAYYIVFSESVTQQFVTDTLAQYK